MPDPSAERPVVGWCTGKDCRAADRDGSLRAVAAERAELVDLRCLDVCDGDDPVVFRKVRKRKVLRDVLRHLATGAELTPRAAERRVTGKKRKRAVARIERRR